MPATPVWLARLEAALNRALAYSSAAAAAAARLQGTSIEIHVDGLTPLAAAVVGGRLTLMTPAPDAAPDAVIRGSLFALLRAALNGGAPSVNEGLTVTGDAEIAAGYRSLFRASMPDVEEQIARLIGDTPARAIGNVVSGALGLLRRTRRTAEQNIAEYLQEESRDLVSRAEVDEFLNGVDAVRATADRVSARLQQLEQRLKGTA